MGAYTQSASVNLASSGSNTLVTGVAGKRIRVFGYVLVNGVATTQACTWRSGSTDLAGAISLPLSVGGGLVVPPSESMPWFTTADGANLNLVLGASTQVSGHVIYQVVPA